MLLLQLAHTLMNVGQPHGVGVPHRPAAVGREAVAVDVDDVDVAGAKGEAFLEDACPFVDQRVDDALDDLFRGHGSPNDPRAGTAFFDELLDLRVGGRRATTLGIAIPARAGLLAEPAAFAEPIRHQRHAAAFGDQVLILLADAPAHVEPGEVADRQRAHRHAELDQGGIDLLDASAFLQQELRLALVGPHHAISHTPRAIPTRTP